MGDIKILDYAKSVESSKNFGVDILNNKNVLSSYKDSLHSVISKITQLPDNPKEETEVYQPDQYFVKMEQDYLNDPLLQMNGGFYVSCHYMVIRADYDTTYLNLGMRNYSGIKPYIITSDGQEFKDLTAASLTITWDKTKDIDTLEDGTVVRWIKLYRQYELSNYQYPCYPENSTTNPSPLVFTLIDSNTEMSPQGGDSTVQSLGSCKYLQYIIFGKSIHKFNSTNYAICKQNLRLECIKSYNPLSIVGRFVGNGCKNLKFIPKIISIEGGNTCIYSGNFKTLDLREVYIDYTTSIFSYVSSELENTFLKIENVLLDYEYQRFTGFSSLFIKHLFIPKSKYGNTITITAPQATTLNTPTEFNNSLTLRYTTRLEKQSILRLFNNLKDLTGETNKTLSLSNQFNFDLTEEELAIATNNNWTVTFIN